MENEEVKKSPDLGEVERNQLLYGWNPEPTDYPESTVQHLFEKQVAEHGESVALVFGEYHLTYQELNERANRLAHYLIDSGVTSGQSVALFLERGVEQIVSTLAILKAGAAYIPIDVDFPDQRIVQMLEDAAPRRVLSHSAVAGRLSASENTMLLMLDEISGLLETKPDANPEVRGQPDDLAYIMYTSGSTGRPKGVEVVHRGIVRLLFGVDYVPYNSDTVILHIATVSFDATTFEIWGALLHGGTCILCPSRVPTLEMIGQLLGKYRVNTFLMTTAFFNLAIKEAPQILKPVKYLLVGGEALSSWHVEKALRELPGTQLINAYGPTENTVISTTYTFDRDTFDPSRPIPIGRAIGNSSCYVLDQYLRPVPVGVSGELYVGGAGLARGYANRPDLTAEYFLADPFSAEPGARMYKTGDMVGWTEDGQIEFMGRIDHQVKLRGFRIELQEIDVALSAFPGVEQAVTVVCEDDVRGKWLVSYIKVSEPEQFPIRDLKKFAGEKLPDYMVPAMLMPITEWSFTPSGKLDREALPKPASPALETAAFKPPETEIQRILAGIWQRLLNVQRVGIDDNFFELGGDSLRGVQLFHEIHSQFGQDLPLSTLSQHPSIRDFAGIIDSQRNRGQVRSYRSLQVLQEGDPGIPPLLLIHGGGGNVVIFREFIRNLGVEQPVYAFQWSGWDGSRGHRNLKEMAAFYMEELLCHSSSRMYRLGGHSVGGLIAIELANELRKAGIKVENPIIISDCPNLESREYRQFEPELLAVSRRTFGKMVEDLYSRVLPGSCEGGHQYTSSLKGKIKNLPMMISLVRWVRMLPTLLHIHMELALYRKVSIERRSLYSSYSLVRAARKHTSTRYSGDVLYFRSHCVYGRDMRLQGWWNDCFLGFGELCDGRLEGYVVGGGHNDPWNNPATAKIVKQTFGEQTKTSSDE